MTQLGILFISFFVAASAENYKDLIEKAQNLILQKDRQQATNILIAGLRRENRGKLEYTELKKTLEDIGGLFLSDKAQQSYELSLSYKRKELNPALDKINESLRTEPDNTQAVAEKARLLILKNDCVSAQDELLKIYRNNTFDENILIAMAQTQLCLNAVDQYFSVRSHMDQKRMSLSYDWNVLEFQRTVFEKNKVRSKEIFETLKKMDPKNPQLTYWEWKLNNLNGKSESNLIEKYAMNCRNISAQTFRFYLKDPYFCNKQAEMENESAKKI